MIRPENRGNPGLPSGFARSRLPGISVVSLISGIELGTLGSRLQSITSRE